MPGIGKFVIQDVMNVLPSPREQVRTSYPITTKLRSHMPLVMLLTWLNFGGILLEKFYWLFFFKILDVFYRGQPLYWPYLRNDWSNWLKTTRSTLTGYWANCVTTIFDLISDLDLRFSRVNFEIALSQEWEGWFIWKEKDVCDLGLWPHPWPSFWISRSNIEIISQGREGQIDVEWKWCMWP